MDTIRSTLTGNGSTSRHEVADHIISQLRSRPVQSVGCWIFGWLIADGRSRMRMNGKHYANDANSRQINWPKKR